MPKKKDGTGGGRTKKKAGTNTAAPGSQGNTAGGAQGKPRKPKPAVPGFNDVEGAIPGLNLEDKGSDVYSILSNCILVTGDGSSSTSLGNYDGGHYLLDEPDHPLFPIGPSIGLDNEQVKDKDISNLSLYNLLKGPFGVNEIFETKNQAIAFIENVRFKTYDSAELRVAKLKEFYRFMASKGVAGLPSFPVHLINKVPTPQEHSSYVASDARKGKTELTNPSHKKDMDPRVDLGAKSLANRFIGHFDSEYVDSALKQILKPHVKNTVTKIVKEINRLGLMPSRININNIDFLDKFVVDIIHATVSSNDDFFMLEYGIGSKFLTDAGMGDAVFDQRNYTTKEIVNLPTWRLTQCTGEQVFYTRQQPYWGYSLTGIFGLIQGQKGEIPPDNEFTGNSVVFLKEYSTGEVYSEYTGLQGTGSPPSYVGKPWSEVGESSKSFFYPQDSVSGLPVGIYTGCYYVEIGYHP
ncbi:MAG: hypothetical protein CMM25_01120, partial [Rhodospirillaceae bacterium]|nr:hypothetical protein [Rhodospirillaceae bacterium]